MSRPAPLQLHAGARGRRLAVVTYGQDARRFGFPPAFFPSMIKDRKPQQTSQQQPMIVDVVRIHRNLTLAVIAVAMVAMAVVLL